MKISVSGKPGVPLYEQVKNGIRGMKAAGVLMDGSALPSIRELAADSGVSVITVRRAYGDLAKEGLIYPVHGKGYYMSGVPSPAFGMTDNERLMKKLGEWAGDAAALGVTREFAMTMLGAAWDRIEERKDRT